MRTRNMNKDADDIGSAGIVEARKLKNILRTIIMKCEKRGEHWTKIVKTSRKNKEGKQGLEIQAISTIKKKGKTINIYNYN